MRILDRVMLAEIFPTPLTICTIVFPHLITFCTRLMFNHVRVGKEWASPVFPHPLTSNFRFYMYTWQGKVGWVFPHLINHMHNSFSPPDNLLHKVDWSGPVFPHPLKKQRLYVYSWQAVFFRRRLTICTTVFPHQITFWTRLIFKLVRVGKKWAGPVFPHPLTSNFRFYMYSWQGKVSWVFPQPINHMHNNFSPPDNLLHKVDV